MPKFVIFTALVLVLLNPALSAPAKVSPKLVFAHYMVCCPTAGGAATIEDYKREIQAAQSRGIDGFALNCGGWFQEGYKTRTTLIYEAARRLGTGFKLFISADYCCSNGLAETRDMVESFRDHPNQFRCDGKPVLSSFGGEGTKGLAEFIQSEFQSKPGKEIVWVPYFFPKTYHEHPAPADVKQVFSDYPHLDGYFYFGATGTGDEITRSNHLLAQKWLGAGKIFMAGVTPYYRSFGRLSETDGFKSMAQEWEGAIRDGATWVEIVTWNDWSEKTYVAPFGPPEKTDLWGGNFGKVNYDHVAYLEASRYYIDWFKTGVQPKISKDKIFYFYRTERKSEAIFQMTPEEEKRGLKAIDGADTLQDKVFVTCFLPAPARLILFSGDGKGGEVTMATFDVPIGVTHLEMPFARGVQHFILRRGGKTVINKIGEQLIRDQLGVTRYNYFSGSVSD